MANIQGREALTDVKYTLVYQATHDGKDYLPFMRRSFISFSFGERDGERVNIEDFNLIATTVNNSLNRSGYSSFKDTTSSYDNLDGQQYWSTHYSTNTLDFTLATDGMDLRLLDDFLFWFLAGTTRELILSEHPNRGALARVSRPPQLNLLPFETVIDMKISNTPYQVHTTLYKGTITLNFVMDLPHWYALTNLLGKKKNNKYLDLWNDANGKEVSIFASQDALKILYEDGIPLGSMIQSNMLLGNGVYALVESEAISSIWSIDEDDLTYTNNDHTRPAAGTGARIEDSDNPTYELGIIAGAIITESGLTLDSGDSTSGDHGYFYYSGTAPAPTLISFSLLPQIESSSGYISVPANSYVTRNGNPYNTLTIESDSILELHFTTPNLFSSYNKAISIFTENVKSGSTKSWEDIRLLIREEVHHPDVRAWANNIIDETKSITSASTLSYLKTNMLLFLKKDGAALLRVVFTFNSETGEATGRFKHYTVNKLNNLTTQTEDVGDMLRSNYIIIRDRNVPTENGQIDKWSINNKKQSHRIYHDCPSSLLDLSIIYKNMYL